MQNSFSSISVLDFEKIREIGKGITAQEYYDWIDFVLKNQHDFQMPVKPRMSQKDGDYYAIMPSMYEKDNIAIVKMIGRHALKENEKRSVMMSDMLLYEADTGILKVLMDGEYITTMRSGAIAAHSAVLYGRKDASVIGLIGLGNIMTACMDIYLELIGSKKVTLKLYKHHDQEKRLAERYKDKKNIEFVFCDTYEETIKGSDIIFSAVTRVTENFCSDDCYAEGCTVIPIMTLGFQNCDLFFDHVFTDEIAQIRNFKYFNEFKTVANTTDVLNNRVSGRTNDKERILVYNYGLSILDMYIAHKFYLKSEGNDLKIPYNYCKEKFFM